MASRPVLALTLLAAVAGLSGCGKEEGDDHVRCEAPGGCVNVQSTLGTGEAVSELIPDGAGGVYAAFQGSGFHPACAGGVVCHGELWRIDRFGEVDWKAKEGKSVSRPFLVPGGVAYRTGAGTLVVVDDDGDERWRLALEDPELAASRIGDAIFVAAAGTLARVDPATGDVVWSQSVPETRPLPPAGTGNGLVLTLGFSSAGELTARTFDRADGRPDWTAVLPAELSAPGIVRGYTALAPILLVSDRLSLRDWSGGEVWAVDGFEGYRFVSATRFNGYFAGGPFFDQVTEYRADGTVAWSRPMSAGVTWISPTPDGHVLVGQVDGIVRKLKGGAGTTLWDYGGVETVQAQAPPLYGPGGTAVFWGANIGLDSDTHLSTVTSFGQSLERWDAGARIVSGAISDDGDVFVSTLDGRVYLRDAATF